MVGAELRSAQLSVASCKRDRLGGAARGPGSLARLLRLASVSGWSGPSFDSRSLSVSSCKRDRLGGAAGRPRRPARLLRLASVSGWSRPSFDSRRLSVASCSATASAVRPAAGRRWRGCCGWRACRGGRRPSSRPAQLTAALELPDRQRGLTQVEVRDPQRVADLRLDDGWSLNARRSSARLSSIALRTVTSLPRPPSRSSGRAAARTSSLRNPSTASARFRASSDCASAASFSFLAFVSATSASATLSYGRLQFSIRIDSARPRPRPGRSARPAAPPPRR